MVYKFLLVAFLFVSFGCLGQQEIKLEVKFLDSAKMSTVNFAIPILTGGGVLPDSIDFSDSFPPVGQQGKLFSCASWATVYAMRSYLEKKKRVGYKFIKDDKSLDSSKIFNPLYVYFKVKHPDSNCFTTGTSIDNNFRYMLEAGASLLKTNPQNLTNIANCRYSLNTLEDDECKSYKIDNYGWFIFGDGKYAPHTKSLYIKEFLNAGFPVVIGMNIGKKFVEVGGVKKDGIYIWDEFDTNKGSHAMVCVGYNDNIGKHGIIKVFNSWDTTWGNHGFGYIDDEIIEDMVKEAWVVNIPEKYIKHGFDYTSSEEQRGNENLQRKTGIGRNNAKSLLAKKDSLYSQIYYDSIVMDTPSFAEGDFFVVNRFQPYNNIRIMPVELLKKKKSAVFKVYELKNDEPYEINLFTLSVGDSVYFSNRGIAYHFKMTDIANWRWYWPEKAVFFDISWNREIKK